MNAESPVASTEVATTPAEPMSSFKLRARDGRVVTVVGTITEGDPPDMLGIGREGALTQLRLPSGELVVLLVDITELATSGVVVDPPKGTKTGTVSR